MQDIITYCVILIVLIVLIYFLKEPFRYLQKIKKIKKNLRTIAERLQDKNVKSFNEIFREDEGKFKHLWDEFSESFVKDKNDKIIGNTKRPHDFFNKDHAFFENKIDEHSIEGFSSRAVGIGILGTFLGLTWAIFSLDMDNLKEGIEELLGGAGLAFASSLLGVLSSIIFSFYKEKIIKDFEQQLYKISRILESKYTLMTQEQMLYSQWNERVEVLRENDEHLNLKLDEAPSKIADKISPIFSHIKDAIDNIGVSGGEAVEKTFKESTLKIEDVINNLSSKTDKMTDAADKMAMNTLAAMDNVNKGQINISEKLNESVTTIGNTVRELTGNVSGLFEGALETQEKFRSSAKDAQKEAQSSLDEIIKSGTKRMTEELSESLKRLVETQENITSKQVRGQEQSSMYWEERLKDMEKFQGLIESNMRELQVLINHLQDKIKNEESSLNALRQISSNSSRGLEESKEIIEKTSQAINLLGIFPSSVKGSINEIERVNTEIKKVWEQYDLKFNEVDKS
ncbi:MAG: hypothetical protein OXB88_00310, partial [Bacteriovoracales bacterium]|nr:hypothetical protein [Bacteriovoracales bacterium]